jgi:hypothetical protein
MISGSAITLSRRPKFGETMKQDPTGSRLPDEELYDLQSDPHEIKNLATSGQSEDRATLQKLRGVLKNWIEKTHDQGEQQEVQ